MWGVVLDFKTVEVNWFPVTHVLANLITNTIRAWLAIDYNSPSWYGVAYLGGDLSCR